MTETAEERRERLEYNNLKARLKRAAETAEQREQRLKKRRANENNVHTAETAEEKEERKAYHSFIARLRSEAAKEEHT